MLHVGGWQVGQAAFLSWNPLLQSYSKVTFLPCLRENPERRLSRLDVNEGVVTSTNPDQKRKACFLQDLKQVPGRACQTNTPKKGAVVLHAWGAPGKINGMRSNLTLAWCSCKTCESSTKRKKHNKCIFLSVRLLLRYFISHSTSVNNLLPSLSYSLWIAVTSFTRTTKPVLSSRIYTPHSPLPITSLCLYYLHINLNFIYKNVLELMLHYYSPTKSLWEKKHYFSPSTILQGFKSS